MVKSKPSPTQAPTHTDAALPACLWPRPGPCPVSVPLWGLTLSLGCGSVLCTSQRSPLPGLLALWTDTQAHRHTDSAGDCVGLHPVPDLLCE